MQRSQSLRAFQSTPNPYSSPPLPLLTSSLLDCRRREVSMDCVSKAVSRPCSGKLTTGITVQGRPRTKRSTSHFKIGWRSHKQNHPTHPNLSKHLPANSPTYSNKRHNPSAHPLSSIHHIPAVKPRQHHEQLVQQIPAASPARQKLGSNPHRATPSSRDPVNDSSDIRRAPGWSFSRSVSSGVSAWMLARDRSGSWMRSAGDGRDGGG